MPMVLAPLDYACIFRKLVNIAGNQTRDYLLSANQLAACLIQTVSK